MTLFRDEALSESMHPKRGKILLVQSVPMNGLIGAACLVGLALVLFLFFGQYTKKERLEGVLIPSAGMVRVIAPNSGVVTEQLAQEGQAINKDARLFVITHENQTQDGVIQQAQLQQLNEQKDSLSDMMQRQAALATLSDKNNQATIENLQQQLASLHDEVRVAAEQATIAKKVWRNHLTLVDAGFVAPLVGAQKQQDYLIQLARQKELSRMKVMAQKALNDALIEKQTTQLRFQNESSATKRNLSLVEQSLIENKGGRDIVVTSPMQGRVTAIQAQTGQIVETGQVLLSVVPQQSILEAYMFASSRAIGFIRPGQKVLLRYQAYPYQKFGQHEAEIVNVSQVALSVDELKKLGVDAKEPLYRVTAQLKSQTIMAYGKEEPLKASMKIEADVLLEERRIYEWILEPLYSITGKLKGDKQP